MSAPWPALAQYARRRTRRTRALLHWVRLKALLRGAKGRRRLREGLGALRLSCSCVSPGCGHLVLYCHNIGEVRTALPLVRELLSRDAELRPVVWTKSVVAYHAARDVIPEACGVFYAPMDDVACVERALSAMHPCQGLVVLEGDVRPTMVHTAVANGVPAAFVSGGLSPVEMARHAGAREGQREMLEAFDLLALKSEADAETARRLGVAEQRIFVSGNCRYDIAGLNLELGPGPLRGLLERARADGRRIVIAGSTYRPEEQALARCFARLVGEVPDLLMVVAPRKTGRAQQAASVFEVVASRIARRSRLSLERGPASLQVLVLDTMGELVGTYAYGDVCFVGGSLVRKGGHNIIEAAVHGVPVVFGPSLFNNLEISARLLELEGGLRVADEGGLYPALRTLLTDDMLRERMGPAAQQAVRENAGAVARTVDRLLPLIRRRKEPTGHP